MCLDRTTSGHEVLQHGSTSGLADVLVVSIASELSILCNQFFLPWQHDLVVVREPTSVKVGVPVFDFVLSVGHAEDSKVFLDGGGSNRGVGKNSDIDVVDKRSVEVTNVTCFSTVG